MGNVKRVISLIVLIVVYFGLSSCKKDTIPGESSVTDTESRMAAQDTIETITSIQISSQNATDMETSVAISEDNNESGGGNSDDYTEIKITVSENRYYYDNAEVSFDDLIELFDSLDQNDTIIIHDDYASDKAFENLTSILKEREIPYTVE